MISKRKQIIRTLANPPRNVLLWVAKLRRSAVELDLAALESLKLPDPARLQRLRRQIRQASQRHNFAEASMTPVMTVACALISCCWLVGAVWWVVGYTRSHSGPHADVSDFEMAVIFGWMGFCLTMIALARILTSASSQYSQATLLLILLFGVPVGSVLLTMSARGQHPLSFKVGLITGFDIGAAVIPACLPLASVAAIWASRLAARRVRHFDELALQTLRFAEDLATERVDPLPPSLSRKWGRRLETLAVTAESRVNLHDRIPRFTLRLRAELDAEALRVAEVYRAHLGPIVRARTPADLDPVIESFLHGIEALLVGDVKALLLNAPEHVSRRRAAKDALLRRIPPLILIAAAIWLPGLIGITGVPANSLGILLGVPGVVALISPQAATQLDGALGKVLPFK